MAEASKEYGRKVVDGVEVFEVGKQQLWHWAHWAVSGPNNAAKWDSIYGSVDVLSDSLAKGRYLVVSLNFAVGCILDTIDDSCIQDANIVGIVTVVSNYRSQRAAVETSKILAADINSAKSKTDYGNLYTVVEVWHVVDDGDLWQAWDLEASAAGGDLQAARQWKSTFHDDTYLRRIEERYTGDYHVYDSMVHSPAACIADVTQHDLKSGYKYVYRYWDCCARFLEQRVEDTVSAGITCRAPWDSGWPTSGHGSKDAPESWQH